MNVTVIYSLQPLTLQGAPSSAGHALSVGEHRKMSAHAPTCLAVGVSFLPLALGGMSEAKTTLLSRIDRILGQRLGDLTFGVNSPPLPVLLCFSLPWECRHSLAPSISYWPPSIDQHYAICVLFCDFVCFVLRSLFLFSFTNCFFFSPFLISFIWWTRHKKNCRQTIASRTAGVVGPIDQTSATIPILPRRG